MIPTQPSRAPLLTLRLRGLFLTITRIFGGSGAMKMGWQSRLLCSEAGEARVPSPGAGLVMNP